MKINRLSTYRVAPRWMFLKIETDEGISGWGEAVIEGRARTVETAVREFADQLVGKDPSRINDLWQTMYRSNFYRGGPILMSAIAGIDQALWDIKGKALGVPVYELLGGKVEVQASLNYGLDKTRFMSPVKVGQRVRNRVKVLALEDRGMGRWLLTTENTFEIEGQDKPAIVATNLGMLIE